MTIRQLAVSLQIVSLLVVSCFAIFGLTRLSYDNDYQSIFRANNPTFRRLLQITSAFPDETRDHIILLSDQTILSRAAIQKIRAIVAEAREIEGVASVVSMLDARQADEEKRYNPPLFPDHGAPDSEFEKSKSEALSHPLLHGVFLSHDGTAVIIIVNESVTSTHQQSVAIDARLHEILRRNLSQSGIQAEITGVPAFRIAITESIQRDLLRSVIIGSFSALCITWLMFRSLLAVFISAIGPLVGMLWSIGLLGIAGEKVNVLNAALPSLILVLGFTDSMHITSHMRRLIAHGASAGDAASAARKHVLFPCLLTALATSGSFLALLFSDSVIIQRFGPTCAIGGILVFLACMLVIPVVVAAFVPGICERAWRPREEMRESASKGALIENISKLSACLLRKPRLIVLIGIVLLIAVIPISSQAVVDYRLRENLPDGHEAVRGLLQIENKFGGAVPIAAVIEWDASLQAESVAVSTTIERVHAIFQDAEDVHSVLSLRSIVQSAGRAALERTPPNIMERLLNREKRCALVRGALADAGSLVQKQIIARLEQKLEKSNQVPGVRVSLAGTAVVAARQSERMILDLAPGLGCSTAFIFVLVAVSFRSLGIGAIALFPNVLPIISAAALLALLGLPIQYSSIMAFVISLGIAMDDTIHFLWQLKCETAHDEPVETAVQKTIHVLSMAVLGSSAVLIAGFLGLSFAEMPTLRIFGWLCCFGLLCALISELIFTPALILCFGRSLWR